MEEESDEDDVGVTEAFDAWWQVEMDEGNEEAHGK